MHQLVVAKGFVPPPTPLNSYTKKAMTWLFIVWQISSKPLIPHTHANFYFESSSLPKEMYCPSPTI